ncbi:MAG: Rrf2 family transcriptional regulator [Lentisphaerae bacterium]|nr:MAG: Rrf2 family transcriptional regulator [Lentisphaerota bacterium]
MMKTHLNISEAASIAIHTMSLLAEKPDQKLTNQQICDVLGCSNNTLAKVLQVLRKHGMIHSERGPNGGSTIAIDPENVSIGEILVLFDGPAPSSGCCLLGYGPCRNQECILGGMVNTIHQLVMKTLNETSLRKLAQSMKLGDPHHASP